MMERPDIEQRAERRAERRNECEQEEHEREQQQYNIAESEGERDDREDHPGSSTRNRANSSRRNMSISVARNAIVNSFKLNLPVFKGSRKADPDVHIQTFEQSAELKGVEADEFEDYFPTTLKELA